MFNHALPAVLRRGVLPVTILATSIVSAGLSIAQETSSRDPILIQGRDTNEYFAELGRQVPEFGGMFIDPQQRDTLDVYVLRDGPDMAERLDAAINGMPDLASARAAQTRIKLLRGQYSFVQLKQWHDRASLALLGLADVVLTAIDQQANRIVIGVKDLAVAADVTETLARFDIPRAAANLEQVEFPEGPRGGEESARVDDVPADRTTLQSKIRPLVGGIQISNTGAACTLGFIAERSSVSGFVTNSHCTKVSGGVEDTVFYQPDVFKVATETVDPCFFWRGPEPSFPPKCKPVPRPIPRDDDCLDKEACRYSDSAFAAVESDIPVMLGFIARPTRERTIEWDPSDTFYKIVGEQNVMMQNTSVSIIGSQTGWTEELVQKVCVNRKTGDDPTYDFICQNTVSRPGNMGDSGSPVIVCIDNSNPPKIIECPGRVAVGQKNVNARLVGLLWGTNPQTRFRSYSPIGSMTDGTVKGVQQKNNELGPLKKCAENGC